MSTASGDEAAAAHDVNDTVSVVSSVDGEKSAAEKSATDASSKYSTASEAGSDPPETGGQTNTVETDDQHGPTITVESDDQQHDIKDGEDGEVDEHPEDGDLSEDGSSVAGSSKSETSQVPDAEREEGDGQEIEEGDKKDKKLDHDEDRRDPQYIPKRGVFYEHDDRTLDEDPEDKKELPREPRKSKAEHIERWGHDMYNEDEQSPKTTDELVDAYGYDIRKEEAPPKARRRRRYGKGPNKYERSWEDEQAYNKTPTRGGYRGGQKRSPRNFVNRDEDFPSLPGSEPVGGQNVDSENSARPPPPLPQRDHEPRMPPKPSPEDKELTRDEIKSIFDNLDVGDESSSEDDILESVSCREIETVSFCKGESKFEYYPGCQNEESPFLTSLKPILDNMNQQENDKLKSESLILWVSNQNPAWGDVTDAAQSTKPVFKERENRAKNQQISSLVFRNRNYAPLKGQEPDPVEYVVQKPQRELPPFRLKRDLEQSKANHQSFPKKHSDSFRGSPAVRGRGVARRGRPGHDSVQPFTKSQAHGLNHAPDKLPKVGSTADEDIAMLAQHFSNAVINVNKNIAPIGSQSEPPAEERPRHSAASAHQPHRHEGHHKHQEKHHPPPTNPQEKQMAPEQPSTKSKRYSTQRQRPPTGGQAPPTSAPPPTAQQIQNAPNYLPPQQGYYPPPQHGICPPENTPHIAAPPAQFPVPGVQMVTFLPTVPPPPTNTFQPPPNIYVPPTPYIPPPPIVQPGPAELYQGGVTYYNTQSQPLARAPPSRRVKLAIPIVAPDASQPIQ